MLQYPLNKMLQYAFAKCYKLRDNRYKILASFNFHGMTSDCCCHLLRSHDMASRHALDIHVLLSECPVKVKCGNILILKTMGIRLYLGFAKAKWGITTLTVHVAVTLTRLLRGETNRKSTSFTAALCRLCDSARLKGMTRLVTNIIAKDMLPLNFVEMRWTRLSSPFT